MYLQSPCRPPGRSRIVLYSYAGGLWYSGIAIDCVLYVVFTYAYSIAPYVLKFIFALAYAVFSGDILGMCLAIRCYG